MSGSRGSVIFNSKLVEARKKLRKAQLRVAELENQLGTVPSPSSTRLRNDDHYRLMFDTFVDGCQVIDFDWRYVYVNDAAARYIQHTKNDLLGHTMQEILPDIESLAMFAVIRRCMQERMADRLEHRVVYPDGTSAWFELRLQPVPDGLLIFSTENTKDYSRELVPIAGNQQLRMFVEHAPAAIAMLDTNMRYLLVSQRWLEDYGLSEANVIGRSHYEIFPDIPDRWREIHQRCLQGAVESNESEPFPRADGSLDWVRWEIRPWRGDDGEIGGVFIYSEMITERQLAQDELQALYEATSYLFSADNLLELGKQITEAVVRVFDHADCGLMLVNDKLDIITRVARAGIYNVRPNVPLYMHGKGLVPLAVRTGEIVYSPDVTLSPDYILNDARTKSELVIPLKTARGVIGALDLQRPLVGAFNERDQRILAAYGERAAAAIETMQLYEAINQHALNLEERVTQRTTDLNQAKERVEAILNNSPDGILLIRSDLLIKQTNASFNKLLGCEPDEYVNKSLLSIIHASDAYKITQLVETISLEQRGKHVEVRTVRKDNSVFDAELSIGFIKGDGLTCIIRDITERKAHEYQLRYQATLQENISDAVIVTDMKFRIQSWNQAAERIYGWQAAEMIGKTTAEILRTEFATAEERERSIQQLHEQGWWEGEVIQYAKDGRQCHILGSVTLIKDENGIPFSVVALNHDITERKQIEKALQQSSAEIHDLYNNAPCGYHSIDEEGVIIQINDTELNWLGYSREEVVGKLKIIDIMTPASLLTIQKNFPIFKQRGWVNDLQLDILRKDGTVLPIILNGIAIYDEHGRFVKSRSSLFDMTALRQAEAALVESEARYRLMAEKVSDVLVRLNADGIRTFVSPSCYALLGYTPDELIGRRGIELIHPDDLPALQEIMTEAIRTGKPAFVVTQRLRHKDGHYLWCELTSSIIRDVHGAPIEFVGITRNVTERKQAEEALNARMTEERNFQAYLKALHEITIELTQIQELNDFYKRAVELGRQRLGFERLALFLYDQKAGIAQGTFGTDAQGKLADERHIRFVPQPDGIMLRSFARLERFYYRENATLYANNQPVGIGWNAATVLWNGNQGLGWLVADSLQNQVPASKALLDILGLYALTIGTLLAQKQVQLAQQESEARYRLLAENVTDVISKSNANGIRTFVTPSCYTLVGHTPDELIGQPSFDIIHPEDRPTSRSAMMDAIQASHPSFVVTHRVRHKDGHYIWTEDNMNIIRDPDTDAVVEIVGVLRDVTERKRAEEVIRDSEARYRLLIETMRGGLVIFDIDNKITFINDRFCEMLGYSSDEVIGTKAVDYVDEANLPILKSHVSRRHALESSSYELVFRHKEGTPVYALVSGSPLIDRNGGFNGSFAVVTDISVQKQAEETLRQALVKEKELGELKTRFVSMASHEFRTPLATILALTETLSLYRHKLPDEKVEDRLNKIRLQIEHLASIMEDVLMLARMQSRRVEFNPTETDTDALCRSVLDEFESRADIKPRLEYVCSGETYNMTLDPKLIRQIITNLVSNAIKYSPPEKPVSIKLEYRDDAIVLNVRDQGIGIPETELNHLFEAFYRASNVGTISGTGLGLVITKEAVERHGGTISVESQMGAGTTFTVCLPRSGR